jgi:hypothetical protein
MKSKFFVYIILMLVSVLLLYLGYPGINKGLESKKWPVVKGSILSSTIIAKNKRKKTSKAYYPVVLYEYTVNNKKYQNNKVTSQDSGGSENSAKNVIAKYTPQTVVDVHYDPKNPANSLLETGVQLVSIILTTLGGVFFIFINFFFFLFKARVKA